MLFDNCNSGLGPGALRNETSTQYDLESLAQLPVSANDLALLFVNIRSLPSHIDHYLDLLSVYSLQFDIYCFVETWMTDLNVSLYPIPGYSRLSIQRPIGKKGGGVAIYYRDSFLKCHEMSLISDNVEMCLVLLDFNKVRFCCVTVYKPPMGEVRAFCDELSLQLENVHLRSSDVIVVVGDFNVDLITPSVARDYLLCHMSSLYLVPMMVMPTRITDVSHMTS